MNVRMASYSGGAAFDREGKKLKSFRGGGNHFENFIEAVRSRKHEDLNADILDGHLSSALCHLGNISLTLGHQATVDQVRNAADGMMIQDNSSATFDRMLEHLRDNDVDLKKYPIHVGKKLTLDPGTEKFVDDPDADRLLTRKYRKPFVVPESKDI